MPFLHEFKLAGSYTLPWWGIQTNLAFQSYNGQPLFTRWNIGPTTRYAANCPGPCRPGELVVPNLTLADLRPGPRGAGQQYYERQNQFDMGFRKLFRFGRYQLSAQADIFNIVNSSYVKNQNITYRLVARPAARHPPAAHPASGGAAPLLRILARLCGGAGRFPSAAYQTCLTGNVGGGVKWFPATGQEPTDPPPIAPPIAHRPSAIAHRSPPIANRPPPSVVSPLLLDRRV